MHVRSFANAALNDYQLRVQAPELTVRHTYQFGYDGFAVTVLCDGLG